MQKYVNSVTIRAGAAVAGASVLVKTYPGAVNATIYSDDGVTEASNPLTTDANGEFSFYAEDGRYSLTISKTGVITQRTVEDILLADPDDGEAEQSAADTFFSQSGIGAVSRTANAKLGDIISGEDFDLPTDGSTSASAAIQNALNEAVLRGGRTVWIRRNASGNPYLLTAVGASPYESGHQYCLNINGNNVRLVIEEGVVLKLKDGQQTDAAGPVDLIISRGRSRIVLTGGGRITGNTAGQTGWTGGYAQVSNGNLIRLHGETGVSGMKDLKIEGLQLDDHFSNPIDFDNSTARHTRVMLRDLYGFDCGEGFQLVDADDVWLHNLIYEDLSDVAVGDGIELSDVTQFSIKGCRVRTNGTGTAFDLFGARDGVLEDFQVTGWGGDGGLQINDDSEGNKPENIIVKNGVIKDTVANGVLLSGTNCTNVKLNGVIVQDCGTHGFQVASDDLATDGPISIEGCEAVGCGGSGLLIKTVTSLKVHGGRYSGNTTDGIAWQGQINATDATDTANLHISGVTANGNGGYGIRINDNGLSGKEPSGYVTDCDLRGNTTGPMVIGGNCGQNLRFENINPSIENDYVDIMDDFVGDVLADQWGGRVGSDPQCVTPTLTNLPGGKVRLTTGDDAAGTMAVNGSQLERWPAWRALHKEVTFEIRLTISAVTGVSVFVGLTDQVSALEIPIESAASLDTVTTNASNAVGVLFDTSMATDNWWLVGVAGDVDATAQNSAVAPVGGTYETWKISLSSAGDATFYRNGVLVGSAMTSAVSSGATLTPVVAALSRGSASRNIDVDYIRVRGRRG